MLDLGEKCFCRKHFWKIQISCRKLVHLYSNRYFLQWRRRNNFCRVPINHAFHSIASISAQGCGARNYKLNKDYSAICKLFSNIKVQFFLLCLYLQYAFLNKTDSVGKGGHTPLYYDNIPLSNYLRFPLSRNPRVPHLLKAFRENKSTEWFF